LSFKLSGTFRIHAANHVQYNLALNLNAINLHGTPRVPEVATNVNYSDSRKPLDYGLSEIIDSSEAKVFLDRQKRHPWAQIGHEMLPRFRRRRILIRPTTRSPERVKKTRAFLLTKTYMDGGDLTAISNPGANAVFGY
jgi:hypothetical protein